MPKIFQIGDDEILDFKIDWQGGMNPWLEPGDTIDTSTWAADTGITIQEDSKTDTTTTVWLKDAVAGKTYCVTNTIVTTSSPARTAEQTLYIRAVAKR